MIRLDIFRVFAFVGTKWRLALNWFVIWKNTGKMNIKSCRLKKPFVAIINEFLRCYVRNEAKTLLYLHSAIFTDVVLCRLNQLKTRNSGFTVTWETNVRKEIEKKGKKESVKINVWKEKNEKSEKREWEKKVKKQSERKKWEANRWAKNGKNWESEKKSEKITVRKWWMNKLRK